MVKIDRAVTELREMDEYAAGDSPLHRLHPLSKLLMTIAYIFITVSFGKYDLTGLCVMILFPLIGFTVSGIPVSACFHKLRYVLPLVCAVGLFNPIFDRETLLTLGNIAVSGGFISMLTLMMKGVFSLMASFLLAATTRMDAVCAALRKIRVPSVIVTVMLLTYRYVTVMLDEVSVMTQSYRLRAPGQKGIHFSAWGSFLGQLLLRSADRAQELYQSMTLRGFAGEFRYAAQAKATGKDVLVPCLLIAAFLLCRSFDIAYLLGAAF